MQKFRERFYLRGWSPLGVFNTIIGPLFNRVLVKMVHLPDHTVVGYRWDLADKYPRAVRQFKPALEMTPGDVIENYGVIDRIIDVGSEGVAFISDAEPFVHALPINYKVAMTGHIADYTSWSGVQHAE
jgi:hypothetical protein